MAVPSSSLEGQVGDWLTTLRLPDDWRADIARMQGRIAGAPEQRPSMEAGRVERQLTNLKELFIVGDITREEYVGRSRALKAALREGAVQPTYSEAVLVKAARLLADLADLWRKATQEERHQLAQNLFAEVRVRDSTVVSVRLAHDEYLPLIASATARGQVGVARPEGFEPPTL